MLRVVKAALWVHLVVSAALGVLLVVIPGRFLDLIGWAPIDPILSRVLGAALLALAWGDQAAARRFGSPESALFAQVHLAFSALAAIGVWRHLLVARWPALVWVLGVALLLSVADWALALLIKRG